MIISIEGITKTGKSSLCQLLSKRLEATKNVINLNDKIDKDEFLQALQAITNPVQYEIRPIEELFLYLARFYRKTDLVKLLYSQDPNQLIILDRYTHSIIAFFEGVRKLEKAVIKNVIDSIVVPVIPDITFFIDSSLDLIKTRLGDRALSRKNQGLEQFYEEYRLSFLNSLGGYCKRSVILSNQDLSIDKLADCICQEIENSN